MDSVAAERTVVLTLRLLAGAFAVSGILFLVTPDGVVGTLDDVGDVFGSFAQGPESEQKLWLGLAFAYMAVIAGIALLVSTDVARYRPCLLVLAAGKVASSLAAGAFFVLDDDVFIYLVGLVVDGSLVAVVLACWVLAGRVEWSGGRARSAQGAVPARSGSQSAPEVRPAGESPARGT